MRHPDWYYDLMHDRHTERRLLEDYDFLAETGTSHEQALERLSLSQKQWDRIQGAVKARRLYKKQGA